VPSTRGRGCASDQSIALDGFYTRQEYPQSICAGSVLFDPETGKTTYLSDPTIFALPALTIAALYKRRWQVDCFSKWIKQNLPHPHFYGTSENAVKTQI